MTLIDHFWTAHAHNRRKTDPKPEVQFFQFLRLDHQDVEVVIFKFTYAEMRQVLIDDMKERIDMEDWLTLQGYNTMSAMMNFLDGRAWAVGSKDVIILSLYADGRIVNQW